MKITFECYFTGNGRRKSKFYKVEADENDVKDNFITLDNKVWNILLHSICQLKTMLKIGV